MTETEIQDQSIGSIVMARRFQLAVLILAAAMPFPLAAADPVVDTSVQEPEPNYHPLKVGSTWNYRVGEKKIVTKITKHDKFGGQMCAVLETIVDGITVATEHLAVTKDGLARFGYKDKKIEPAIVFLKPNAKKGETWPVSAKIDQETIEGTFERGEDDVDVPGYKGKTVTVTGDFKINGQAARFVYWFAEKKGIVKQQLTLAGQDIMLELEKFEEGK